MFRSPQSLGLVWALALLAAGGPVRAQMRHREGRYPIRSMPEERTAGGFAFCRLIYDSDRWEWGGIGWQTDYPYAEMNLMTRLAELTTATISLERRDEPNYYAVRLTEDALFRCPFLMASDVGTLALTSEEADRLRTYLLKGGFFWVDDFWGTAAWVHWVEEIGRVLPPDRFPIKDVPLEDAMLQTPYVLPHIPQITSLQNWLRSGGTRTSERGEDSPYAELKAIRDQTGRILVLMSHNTDIADAWEREGDDYSFFYRFAHDGYALGIDVLVHSMTHE